MNWPKWPKHFTEIRPKNLALFAEKLCGVLLAVGAATFGERFIEFGERFTEFGERFTEFGAIS